MTRAAVAGEPVAYYPERRELQRPRTLLPRPGERPIDGPTYLVTVTGNMVESHSAAPTSPARAVIEATSRDLLAVLLGRSFHTPPRFSGDTAFGHAFSRAFPGP